MLNVSFEKILKEKMYQQKNKFIIKYLEMGNLEQSK